jgi:DNA-directed RNA polymerase subunit E'/Rpb7
MELLKVYHFYNYFDNGSATFKIKYKAIVFKPFKGEIIDAVVIQVVAVNFLFIKSDRLFC